MRVTRSAAIGVVSAFLSAGALLAWRIQESRAEWTPVSFPLTFDATRQVRHEFNPDRTGTYQLVLDLQCPAPAHDEERLLDPAASKLPFSWRVLANGVVVAEGRLGAKRRRAWDPVLRGECGQIVGRFSGSDSLPYQLDLHVERFAEADICRPRVFVGLTQGTADAAFVKARLILAVAVGLGLLSVACFALALFRTKVDRRAGPSTLREKR